MVGNVTRARRGSRIDHAGQVRDIVSGEMGCKGGDEAGAAIRFAAGWRLGAADLDNGGEEILAALKQLAQDGGGNWTGYLNSAVKAWKAQA